MDGTENPAASAAQRSFLSIGLLGFGTVGAHVYRLLQDETLVAARAGVSLRVKKIAVLDPAKARPVEVPPAILTTDASEIVASPDVDIVVELIGGLEPAHRLVLEAIERGKAVVTANKQLMATHGPELLGKAETVGVELGFEGSVGAGIPLIKPIRESLAAAHIRAVTAILNGTTNYILTRMAAEGWTFEAALAAAQRQGFAEADPREDIEGHDAAAKLAILASAAFGCQVTNDDVYREGIASITPKDIAFAKELGFAIKLLAIARSQDGEIEARVHPALIPLNHPLATVADEFNAVLVDGPGLGPVIFSGRGAGGAPTAVAVVGDLVAIGTRLRLGIRGRVGGVHLVPMRVRPIEEVVLPCYLSLQVIDRPGVFARVASVFGDEQVSIASIVQKSRGAVADVVLVTHDAPERAVRRVLARLREMDVVKAIPTVIRVEATI